jgi:hypothetical protein
MPPKQHLGAAGGHLAWERACSRTLSAGAGVLSVYLERAERGTVAVRSRAIRCPLEPVCGGEPRAPRSTLPERNRIESGTRLAGFEPATRGLEVRCSVH